MSIYENFEPINFNEINTYELASRPSKVTVKDFAKPLDETDSLKDFLKKTARYSCRSIAQRNCPSNSPRPRIRKANRLGNRRTRH